MGASSALRTLANFLEECEREVGTVDSVGFTESICANGSVSAEIELTVPMTPSDETATAVSLCQTTVNSNGTLHIAFESTASIVPTTGHDVHVEPTDAVFDSDGTITVTLSASVPTESTETDTQSNTLEVTSTDQTQRHERQQEATARSTATEETGDGDDTTQPSRSVQRDRDVPPFDDRELLAEVYDSCDTFAEMTDAIGMDVTAETVRRYMIDHGIHQPNSYQTTASADDQEPSPTGETDDQQTPVVLPDGIGLPEDVTVDAIIETVKRSNTIYEVTQDLGVDRDASLEMLRELDLLDLVVGRLATEGERDIQRDDIIDRLRANSAAR